MNLAPVREMLLAQARAEAARVRAEAQRSAGDELEAARAEAAALLEQAGTELAAAAASLRERSVRQARHDAAAELLIARREAYEELRRRAVAAVQELRRGPEYPALVARLEAVATQQLGEAVVISEDAEGGIRGELSGRSVDYSLPAAVERCLDALGGDLEQLWR